VSDSGDCNSHVARVRARSRPAAPRVGAGRTVVPRRSSCPSCAPGRCLCTRPTLPGAVPTPRSAESSPQSDGTDGDLGETDDAESESMEFVSRKRRRRRLVRKVVSDDESESLGGVPETQACVLLDPPTCTTTEAALQRQPVLTTAGCSLEHDAPTTAHSLPKQSRRSLPTPGSREQGDSDTPTPQSSVRRGAPPSRERRLTPPSRPLGEYNTSRTSSSSSSSSSATKRNDRQRVGVVMAPKITGSGGNGRRSKGSATGWITVVGGATTAGMQSQPRPRTLGLRRRPSATRPAVPRPTSLAQRADSR
jgi:hypothetical protein